MVVLTAPKKNAYYKSQEGILTEPAAWPVGIANNINLIRYSDVLLWAAEADIELGNLDEAEFYVNMIRNRMADHHEAWVHKYLDDSDPQRALIPMTHTLPPIIISNHTRKAISPLMARITQERLCDMSGPLNLVWKAIAFSTW